MKIKAVTTVLLTAFVVLCAALVVESGLFEKGPSTGDRAVTVLASETGFQRPQIEGVRGAVNDVDSFDFTRLEAVGGKARTITLGSVDPTSGFKFQVELSSNGAAVRKATLSEYNDRLDKGKRLVILSPVRRYDGSGILSMANGDFVFVEEGLKLRLDKLDWKSSDILIETDGSEKATFEAIIKDAGSKDAVKLVKSYKVIPESYHLECELAVENLSRDQLKSRFEFQGPVGIGREAMRRDTRKAIAAFVASGQISPVRLDVKELQKAVDESQRRLIHKDASAKYIWAAVVNKYFAAILRPVPGSGKSWVDWITDKQGYYYDPDVRTEGDETVGLGLKVGSVKLAAAGKEDSRKIYKFQLYLGPKDKSLFEKNTLYRELGYLHTIDFPVCCCPASIINPLTFAILAAMKWMYGLVHNYGVVIIILVFVVRLILHPVTKSSQLSMMKMGKLAPQAEEIKKKYANNKAEMNKRMMELYKGQGVSPFMGILPMMLQMPIWIALYSAIYASIDLRGAAFLPVWITDLSAPDALVRFSAVKLPLVGALDSFNLLPILLSVAMYLQQKLMPHPSSQAQTSPQAAQQQKMMMIMMPIMMLLFLYKAPSGLNLYIMASTLAGVFEQHVIRKHIHGKEAKEAEVLVSATAKTGGKVKKKKPKPFFRY